MSGRYLTDLADVLRAAGLDVVEDPGWPTRARKSGGYPDGGPWCAMWHHTASSRSTSAQAEADWCARNSGDRPVCNVIVQRGAGQVWVIAAGCSNTNGQGGPYRLPDGRTVAVNDMNRRAVGIEIANDGVGEPYDARQVDAAFAVSVAVAAAYGFRADNVATHYAWATPPGRKIDPATAAAVAGPWRPRSVTSAGTWSLDDLRAECVRRAGGATPQPPGGDDVDMICVRDVDGFPWVTDWASYATPITEDQAARGRDQRGWTVGPDSGPIPVDAQDTDLLHRISGR